MAFKTYLQGFGATHLFDLDNNGTLTTDDLGSSSTPTSIYEGTYTFDTDPVCEGVAHSLNVVASTNGGTDGAVFTNQDDINLDITMYSTDKRSVLIWCKQSVVQNPTCIYEQGGKVNNFAFMGGALMTWQAADAGQPFLIVQSKSLTQVDRPYCLVGVWEYHTQHSGSGNRVLFYINGILQGISELSGTDPFPLHSDNIACGNSSGDLKSFAETTFTSQTTGKNCNFLGMFNNVSLIQSECREIFERSTFADVTIYSDTVANQQAALDVLIGNTYENTNCAIRIIQATDATNYRLFIDNITFNSDSNLEDISIQFVGTGILTSENTNGTVIKYTSSPPEVETTSATYIGGGSIVVVNNTIRYSTPSTITNSNATKLVTETSGSYEIIGGTISIVENVSGGNVTILISNGAPTPTTIGTGIILTFPPRNISITGLDAGSRLCVYNQTTATQVYNQVISGTSYISQYAEGVGYSTGDVLELKVAKINMLEFSTSVVVTEAGWTVLVSQDTNAIYNAHGKDGSTVTGISWDSGNMQFDFNDLDNNIDGADIGAWYYYFITTPVGIAEAFGALVWSQINKITNATNKVAITFDNIKSSPLQINNCWIDRDDGVSIISPTSNSIQINPPAVFIKESGTSGLTTAESAKLDEIANVKAKTDLLNFTGTDVKATLDGEEVVTDTASRDASKATTTVSSNMRGTDGANTVAPTNETLTVAQNTKLMSLDTDNLDVAVSTRATKADADQALVDYNVDTKTNVKPSIPV